MTWQDDKDAERRAARIRIYDQEVGPMTNWERLYRELQASAGKLSGAVFVTRDIQVEAFGTNFADALLELRGLLGPEHMDTLEKKIVGEGEAS